MQADASKAQRQLAVPTSRKESAHHEDSVTTSMLKKLPAERYCERFNGFRLANGLAIELLIKCTMAQFVGEVDVTKGGMLKRRLKPKVVKSETVFESELGNALGRANGANNPPAVSSF